MKLEGPVRYHVSILPLSEGKLFEIADANGKEKFSGAATSKRPKLYIVTEKDSAAPIYVGITRQSMRTRLRFGWKATGQGGYHGYQWRHHYPEVALDIWCADDTEAPILDIETIEAEVVFLIRQRGQWPLHQTEIHFHASASEHREIAESIVSRYLPIG